MGDGASFGAAQLRKAIGDARTFTSRGSDPDATGFQAHRLDRARLPARPASIAYVVALGSASLRSELDGWVDDRLTDAQLDAARPGRVERFDAPEGAWVRVSDPTGSALFAAQLVEGEERGIRVLEPPVEPNGEWTLRGSEFAKDTDRGWQTTVSWSPERDQRLVQRVETLVTKEPPDKAFLSGLDAVEAGLRAGYTSHPGVVLVGPRPGVASPDQAPPEIEAAVRQSYWLNFGFSHINVRPLTAAEVPHWAEDPTADVVNWNGGAASA